MFFSFFFFKQKTAYELRISDWSSDVCSSDLLIADLVIDADLGLGARRRLFLAVEDARGLGLADRLRLARRTQEARDLRRILDEVIDIVGHRQLCEQDRKSTRLNSSH